MISIHLQRKQVKKIDSEIIRQKLSREIKEIREVTSQISLIDIYRTFYPKQKKYTVQHLTEPSQ